MKKVVDLTEHLELKAEPRAYRTALLIQNSVKNLM